MSERRKFSDEFKREAVGLTHQPGASLSQVARDIGVGGGMLSRWRRDQTIQRCRDVNPVQLMCRCLKAPMCTGSFLWCQGSW
jgi:hypothetical protein